MLTGLTKTVNEIKDDVTDLKSSKLNLSTINQQVNDDSVKLKLLSAMVIRQDERIANLERKLAFMEKQQKRANITISGLLCDSPKEYVSKVANFFANEMEIENPIEISWVSKVNANGLLLVELKNISDKSIIFAHAKNLKGKKNVKRQLFFINDDETEEAREFNNFVKNMKKENRTKEPEEQLDIQFKRGKLHVNNEPFQPKTHVPAVADVLTLDTKEIEEIQEVKTHHAATHQEKNSEFFCYYKKVQNVKEAQEGLTKIKVKHGDASHVVSA